MVGKDVNVQKFADKAYLTGASWNWGPMMTKLVQEIWAGTWKPSHVRGSLADGAVVLDPLGKAVPGELAPKIEQAKADILAGKLVVWKGPLVDQTGKTTVPGGKPMALEQIESMSYLLKGVIGSLT